MRTLSVFVFGVLLLTACKDKAAKELQNLVYGKDSVETVVSSKKASDVIIAQYRDLELKRNLDFVVKLDSVVSTGFERQLDRFEDEELGFWAGYGYMFGYIFRSKEKWENNLRLESDKYFNTLDIEQEANDLYVEHVAYVKQLRERFARTNDMKISEPLVILPQQDIYLGDLRGHAGTNVLIEVSTEIAQWLLRIFIMWIIGLSCIWTGPIIPIIATVLSIIGSIVVTVINDNKLINSIKEQQENVLIVNSEDILNQLNENTIHFYEKFK